MKPNKPNIPKKKLKLVTEKKTSSKNVASKASSSSKKTALLKNNKIDIAILGATGAVGETMLSILEERAFPVNKLYALASHRSMGNSVMFKNRAIMVEDASLFDFSKVQLALFSAGSAVSSLYAEKAAKAGCIVIDNTSKFRLEEDVPLIIPEVNVHNLIDYKKRRIIANPNCAVMQILVAIKPIYDKVGINRLNIATYQSVSGTGKRAISELIHQTATLLNGQPIEPEVYPRQIAFNVLPHCDDFLDNGYTKEEMKIILETKKILEDPDIQVNATAVRVPVIYGHSAAVNLETQQKITAKDARDILRKAPGIILMDDIKKLEYPTPIPDIAGTDAVYVGRVREDISHPLGLNLWVVADNLRKGAALNAIQIAEILVNQYL